MVLKILQWNIWYQEKAENIIRILKEINADILCLQELTITSPFNVNYNIPELISEQLNIHYFFKESQSWDLPDHQRILGNGIFSKSPLIKTSFYFLNESTYNPQDPSDEGRVYIESVISYNNTLITVGTTHLSYTHRFRTTPKKMKEAKKLTDIIMTKKNNYVFTGDLNAQPNSKIVFMIQYFLKNFGPPPDFYTWTTKPFLYNGFEEKKLKWRLDYIFGTQDMYAKRKSSLILDVPFSDHLPIITEIII